MIHGKLPTGRDKSALSAEGITRIIGSGPGAIIPLHPTSLTMDSGQIVMITGPSGSGKTTLLSILGCILRPDAGEVFISGVSTKNQSNTELSRSRARHFGFIFQQYHLFDSLTALGNIELAASMKPREREIIHPMEMLRRIGLGHKANVLPGKLSGGEKQRVAIARALVGDPNIILCDEPTGALDTENAMATVKILCNLAREKKSLVVLVTHDHRLESFADRIIQMEDGRIKHDSDSHPITKRQAHAI